MTMQQLIWNARSKSSMDQPFIVRSCVQLKEIQIFAWLSGKLDQNHAVCATHVEKKTKIGRTHI